MVSIRLMDRFGPVSWLTAGFMRWSRVRLEAYSLTQRSAVPRPPPSAGSRADWLWKMPWPPSAGSPPSRELLLKPEHQLVGNRVVHGDEQRDAIGGGQADHDHRADPVGAGVPDLISLASGHGSTR